ncbi:MAG: leucyl/phenylalanyl-tRNA--protein transferase [Chitinophagales bacterium]|nr:leucyl/phenylalanyl-tRNA--protein transferase [Chitinophagales bacterium]
MPVYQLTEELIFPHPSLAESDGLLAIGGDLSTERLILAYKNGIFPWYNEDEPILWFAPNPRFVLFPEKLKVSKSMKQLINKNEYHITLNQSFENVIGNCKKVKRKNQNGTWITNDMEKAYIKLHKKGMAHSVEVWNKKEELVGGLYGVNLGTVFFGESMFHKENNTSKLALIHLGTKFDFSIIDCQVYTKHLASLGAENIPFNSFYAKIVKETEKQSVF